MSHAKDDEDTAKPTSNPGDLRRENEQPADGSINSNKQESSHSEDQKVAKSGRANAARNPNKE